MKGRHAFAPASGAPLSTETVYPTDQDTTKPTRYSTSHSVDRDGGLCTNGKRTSATQALLTRWLRLAHEHNASVDDKQKRGVALALRRLKSGGEKTWDVWVWIALHERLARSGLDAAWMRQEVSLVCPRCHSELRWEVSPSRGTQPTCMAGCARGQYLTGEIRNRIRATYNAAFDDPLTEGGLTVI